MYLLRGLLWFAVIPWKPIVSPRLIPRVRANSPSISPYLSKDVIKHIRMWEKGSWGWVMEFKGNEWINKLNRRGVLNRTKSHTVLWILSLKTVIFCHITLYCNFHNLEHSTLSDFSSGTYLVFLKKKFKALISSSSSFFFFSSFLLWLHHTASKTLVPQPGFLPRPSAVKA